MGDLELWMRGFQAGKTGASMRVPRDIELAGEHAIRAYLAGWRQGQERRQDLARKGKA